MNKKLEDMNGWELSAALVEIAEPIGNLVNDDVVWDTFVECTKLGMARRNGGMRGILQAYSKIVPLLLKEHRNDTYHILTIIEGKPIDEVMQMNGGELLNDIARAIKENLIGFFTNSVRSGKTE